MRFLQRIRYVLRIANYEWKLSGLSADTNLDVAERTAASKAPLLVARHLDYLSDVYNLLVKASSYFNDRPVNSLTPSALVSLALIARMANSLRSISLVARWGYGADACALAASTFEFGFELAHFARDENASKRWIETEHLTQGVADMRPLIQAYITAEAIPPDNGKVAKRQYDMYAKLCAMKHGNPAVTSFHRPADWTKFGTARLGPDISDYGQKAICFAITLAGQVSEMALSVVAKTLLTPGQRTEIEGRLQPVTRSRLALNTEARQQWTSFP